MGYERNKLNLKHSFHIKFNNFNKNYLNASQTKVATTILTNLIISNTSLMIKIIKLSPLSTNKNNKII